MLAGTTRGGGGSSTLSQPYRRCFCGQSTRAITRMPSDDNTPRRGLNATRKNGRLASLCALALVLSCPTLVRTGITRNVQQTAHPDRATRPSSELAAGCDIGVILGKNSVLPFSFGSPDVSQQQTNALDKKNYTSHYRNHERALSQKAESPPTRGNQRKQCRFLPGTTLPAQARPLPDP